MLKHSIHQVRKHAKYLDSIPTFPSNICSPVLCDTGELSIFRSHVLSTLLPRKMVLFSRVVWHIVSDSSYIIPGGQPGCDSSVRWHPWSVVSLSKKVFCKGAHSNQSGKERDQDAAALERDPTGIPLLLHWKDIVCHNESPLIWASSTLALRLATQDDKQCLQDHLMRGQGCFSRAASLN